MIHNEESNLVIYLCSPIVYSLNDMQNSGLYLSNIPVHDPIRSLVLLSEQFMVIYQMNKRLEELTDRLQQVNRAVDNEKQMTDK